MALANIVSSDHIDTKKSENNLSFGWALATFVHVGEWNSQVAQE